jgi:hypothetical protein
MSPKHHYEIIFQKSRKPAEAGFLHIRCWRVSVTTFVGLRLSPTHIYDTIVSKLKQISEIWLLSLNLLDIPFPFCFEAWILGNHFIYKADRFLLLADS